MLSNWIRLVLVSIPLPQIIVDVEDSCIIENMCGRLNDVPVFDLSVGVPPEMNTPDAPFIGRIVIPSNACSAQLAPATRLMGPIRYDEDVQ